MLQSTERAHEAVCAGMKRQREATELVAQAAELQLRVARGELQQRAVQERCALLLARSRTCLASNESGQRQLDLANTGRKAAEDQYNQLEDLDKFVQSSVWATLRPPNMLQVPQLPPKPDLRGDLARLKERNE